MNMNDSFHVMLRHAKRLIRTGQLMEATHAIQRALGRTPPIEGDVNAAGDVQRAPLEGVFRVLEPVSPAASGATEVPLHTLQPNTQFRAPLDSQWQEIEMPASWSGADPASAPEVLPGARFIAGSYTSAVGTRAYKLYVPSSYHGQALPLVVMLHGCTQSPDDFAAGTCMNLLAEEHSCLVLYPAQAPAANMQKCWNWFKDSDQQRDAGEPSLIAGMTRQIMGTYKVDVLRVYVAGLSAGGAMAAVMGQTYPDLYAAVGVHSGLAYGAARDLPSALAAMQGNGSAPARPLNACNAGTDSGSRTVPSIVFHGDRDTTVHPRNSDQIILQGTSAYHATAGTKPRVLQYSGQVPGGHAYTQAVYQGADGQPFQEHWQIHGAGHAWSGGSTNGSYTDPRGPDAAKEMLRFFHAHPQPEKIVPVNGGIRPTPSSGEV